jgi:4-hydroxy-4-methyl-2-oxoglutarate aldolase
MSSDGNVQRAAKLDTTALSDAMDRLGIGGQCLGIKPLDPKFRLTGRAFTIQYGPAGSPPGTVGDYIDDVEPGGVVVLDNGGRENATVWGDILTMVAHTRGVAGTVIDGACRDVALALQLGYPIFSRSYSMRTGKDRVQVEAMGGTVNIGDARVDAGDLLRGDADGIVAIPRAHEDAVLAAAEEIDAVEERIRKAVQSGLSLREARMQHGYHKLQSYHKP